MPSLVLIFAYAGLLLLTLSALGSQRARWSLLYVMVYMTTAGIQMQVPFVGLGVRLFLALLLLVISRHTVSAGMARLRSAGILGPMTTLSVYLVLSNLVINPSPTFKTAFEMAGNYIFFVLTVSYLLRGTQDRIRGFLVTMVFGLLTPILQYMPAWVPFMRGWSFLGPIPHYQEPASSGMLLLPFLLIAWHSHPTASRKIFMLASMVFITAATFVTGARAPSGAYIAILAFYRRKLWWAVMVILFGLATYLVMPKTEQTQRMVDRIQQLASAAQTGTLREDPDAGMRLDNVRMARQGISEKPVFGWGVGSWFAFRQERTGLMGYDLSMHSGWMLLLFETGIVGLVLYLYAIFKCMKGVRLSFRGVLIEDIGYLAVLGTTAVFLISLGGDALLVRASFAIFALGAFARCERLSPRLSVQFSEGILKGAI